MIKKVHDYLNYSCIILSIIVKQENLALSRKIVTKKPEIGGLDPEHKVERNLDTA